jgi:hypothetical protein
MQQQQQQQMQHPPARKPIARRRTSMGDALDSSYSESEGFNGEQDQVRQLNVTQTNQGPLEYRGLETLKFLYFFKSDHYNKLQSGLLQT